MIVSNYSQLQFHLGQMGEQYIWRGRKGFGVPGGLQVKNGW